MKEWGLTPRRWYAESRPDRAYMRAQSRAAALLEKMQVYDHRQEAERKANLKAKNRGRT